MRNLILPFIFFILLTGCSTGLKNVCISANRNYASQGWKITPQVGYFGESYGGEDYLSKEKTCITFQDSKRLLEEKIKKLDLNMAPQSAYAEARKNDPKYCNIIVRIERYTIDGANTNNFTYVLKQGDEEIYRRRGYSDIANVPIGRYSGWTNSDIIYFKEPDTSFDFYVIDNLFNQRYKFTITPVDNP